MNNRTILVTGSASGIGLASAQRLQTLGCRVIGADLRDADIIADLATPEGRRSLPDAAERLAPEGLDGVIACAGSAKFENPALVVGLNFFGVVATLEGLRPLLARRPRPRAVLISSITSIRPCDEATVEACLAGDETKALREITARPQTCYYASKHALTRWMRRTAVRAEWAGAGILLNGVSPGVVDTPMTRAMLEDPSVRKYLLDTNPTGTGQICDPADIAEALVFLVNLEGGAMVGQDIFVDGGTDALLRPDLL